MSKNKDKIKESYKTSKNIYDATLTQDKWWSKLYIKLFWSGVDDNKIAEEVLKYIPNNFNGELLDEATALSDPENEYKIQKAINEITKDKTVIMIAHRLSTVRNLDKIYVVNEGQIIEEGNHNELVEFKGLYSNMWKEFNQSVQWKLKSEVI